MTLKLNETRWNKLSDYFAVKFLMWLSDYEHKQWVPGIGIIIQ